jgi:ribosomal protein S18 acetylase RimI-like enzyme
MSPRRATAPALRVQVATMRHLEAIIDLEAQSFAACDRFSHRTWRHLLGPAARRGSAVTLVALVGRQVVGALDALLRRDGRSARLYSLAVDPAQRGRGIAALLVQRLARRLPRTIETLSLEVRRDNAPARALYERLGFTVHQDLPGWYGDGGDGVRLRASRAHIARGR